MCKGLEHLLEERTVLGNRVCVCVCVCETGQLKIKTVFWAMLGCVCGDASVCGQSVFIINYLIDSTELYALHAEETN